MTAFRVIDRKFDGICELSFLWIKIVKPYLQILRTNFPSQQCVKFDVVPFEELDTNIYILIWSYGQAEEPDFILLIIFEIS